MLKSKKAQVSLREAPYIILVVGLMFLLMATVALVAEKYGEALTADGIAYNVTQDLQTEISDNTDLAGVVLTISLVGIILTTLVGVFVAFAGRRGL